MSYQLLRPSLAASKSKKSALSFSSAASAPPVQQSLSQSRTQTHTHSHTHTQTMARSGDRYHTETRPGGERERERESEAPHSVPLFPAAVLSCELAESSVCTGVGSAESWEDEVKMLELVDHWVRLAEENLPVSVRDRLTDYVEKYALLHRLPFYELMHALRWESAALQRLLDVCERLGDLSELIALAVRHLNELRALYASYPECAEIYRVALQLLHDLPVRKEDAIEEFRREQESEKETARETARESEEERIRAFSPLNNNKPDTHNAPFSLQLHSIVSNDSATGSHQIGPHTPLTPHTARAPHTPNTQFTENTQSFLSPTRSRKFRSTVRPITTRPLGEYVHIRAYLLETSREDQHYLLNVLRHLPPFEYRTLLARVEELSLGEVLSTLHHIEHNLPASKHCQLCRNKRLSALEFRLCHAQVPAGTLPVPGTLPLYEKNDRWAADDENLFTFDPDKKQIFWNRHYPVNLVEICDNCLADTHRAITNAGRHHEIHHIPAAERVQHMAQLRATEKELARMVVAVAQEKKFRRTREIALTAIRLARRGLKQEADERERRRIEEERQREREREEKEKQRMIAQALESDEKWIQHDIDTAIAQLETRLDYASMHKHEGFSAYKRPAPTTRKSHKSFSLKESDAQGIPLTELAAHRRFGNPHAHIEPDELPHILEWKAAAEQIDEELRRERERIASLQREEQLVALQTMRAFVQEKTTVFARRRERLRRMAEECEQQRVQRRELDRAERRRLRWEEYMAKEREHMAFEDRRSYQLRAYECEVVREQIEREEMFSAECDQCEVDSFWGLDAWERNMRSEEARLRAFYEERVREANAKLVQMGCVKPSKSDEIDVKTLGALKEDRLFWDDDRVRREKVIRRLKAEEIRSQLRLKLRDKLY